MDEHDLEERMAAQIAGGSEFIDDLVEGNILVVERPKARLPRPLHEPPGNVGSPSSRVRMTIVFTKNPKMFSSSGRFRFATGVPTQISFCALDIERNTLKTRQQRHERRSAHAATQLVETRCRFARKLKADLPATVAMHPGTPEIGRHLKIREIRELAAPVGELLLQ